jgi:O-antigen ligase
VLAVLCAPLLGALIARHTSTGIAATVGFVYVPLVFLNLPAALALWVPLTFMTGVHLPASGPAVIAVLLLAAWIGSCLTNWQERTVVIRRERAIFIAIVLFLLWNALSVLWATSSGAALEALGEWMIVAGVFLVFSTATLEPRHARWLLLAFVIGGVMSVAIGIGTTGLHQTGEIATESLAEGRLTGGSSDPNYLGAGLVASMIVAMTLYGVYRRPLIRAGLLGAIVILVAGIVASESRGAMLAAFVAAIAAFVLFQRSRLTLGATLLLLLGLAAAWIAVDPTALHRLTQFGGTGTGRTELWRIAWRVARSNPIVGVGLNNFMVQESHFVQLPGALTAVAMIVETPHVVHNMYLQAFAETGIIGFALLIAIVVALLRSGILAARRFDRAGAGDLATLARGVVVAEVAVFVSLIFLSDGPDERFWVLFAVGAALGAMVPTLGRRGGRALVPARARVQTA